MTTNIGEMIDLSPIMDDIDRKLIGLLRANARSSVASLAKALGVARGTVQNRISKLERNGTIAGYTLRMRPNEASNRIAAITTIAVEGNTLERALRQLRSDPAVETLHTTNGRWDIVAEVRADSLQEIDLVLNRLRQIAGVLSTETSLLLSTHKL
jgi:DNA-binding Lrp family transcriptional regulator